MTHFVSLNDNDKYVKIVPLIIQEFLTPISLAYWIMDDGEFCNGGLRLNTYGFKKEEIFLLMEILKTKNKICSIHSHPAGKRIYISKSSKEYLILLVLPYKVPNKYYKLGLIN
jgi:hypothetical protein